MDVLKRLFEAHFQVPVEQVEPLQGELGGSGRRIIRLAGEKSRAIGILYGVREENVAFLDFSRHFGFPAKRRLFTPLACSTMAERF